MEVLICNYDLFQRKSDPMETAATNDVNPIGPRSPASNHPTPNGSDPPSAEMDGQTHLHHTALSRRYPDQDHHRRADNSPNTRRCYDVADKTVRKRCGCRTRDRRRALPGVVSYLPTPIHILIHVCSGYTRCQAIHGTV